MFDTIERDSLDSNVSIKLTALGLAIDRDLALENAEEVVKHAAESGNFVRIDMEESRLHDADARALPGAARARLRQRRRRPPGPPPPDAARHSRTRRPEPNVRLCKGIYLEPPLIAFQGYQEVRDNFVAALELLLAGGSYVGIATHDEWLIQRGPRARAGAGWSASEYEFQMLLGVRSLRGDRLVRTGHRLRIYTPYGKQWREYSLRRLKENPKIAGYILATSSACNGR